jgi:hypothetical protein
MVVRAIGERQPVGVEEATAELLAGAKRVDAVLSVHSVVVARAKGAVARLDAKLSTAKSAGDLKFFNRACHEYRLACLHRGERPMAYGMAFARLRKLLAGAAATGSMPELMTAVIEGQPPGARRLHDEGEPGKTPG